MIKKTTLCLFCFVLSTLSIFAQNSNTLTDSTLIKIFERIDNIDYRLDTHDRYKLYPTDNNFIFLQLDTKTGEIDLIQWSLDEAKEYSVPLNTIDLSFGTGSGTFELYPTKNIFQFLLLDKVSGRRWHVQWGFEENKRWIKRIY